MIIGSHAIIYSKDAEADRAFLRDVLGFPHADAGQGWLIFGLPPSEVAVHPSDGNDVHELYLMCDDVAAFIAAMSKRGIACAPAENQGWGILTQVSLPGGGKLGVYQPRHARPAHGGAKVSKKPASKPKPRSKAAARRSPKVVARAKTKKKAKARGR